MNAFSKLSLFASVLLVFFSLSGCSSTASGHAQLASPTASAPLSVTSPAPFSSSSQSRYRTVGHNDVWAKFALAGLLIVTLVSIDLLLRWSVPDAVKLRGCGSRAGGVQLAKPC